MSADETFTEADFAQAMAILDNMRALGSRLVEAEKAMRQAVDEGPDPLLDYLHKYDLMDVPE